MSQALEGDGGEGLLLRLLEQADGDGGERAGGVAEALHDAPNLAGGAVGELVAELVRQPSQGVSAERSVDAMHELAA